MRVHLLPYLLVKSNLYYHFEASLLKLEFRKKNKKEVGGSCWVGAKHRILQLAHCFGDGSVVVILQVMPIQKNIFIQQKRNKLKITSEYIDSDKLSESLSAL